MGGSANNAVGRHVVEPSEDQSDWKADERKNQENRDHRVGDTETRQHEIRNFDDRHRSHAIANHYPVDTTTPQLLNEPTYSGQIPTP